MCEPKCVCGRCKYCLEHERYLKERDVRLLKSKVHAVQKRHLVEDSNRLLDSFIVGDISLNDLEVELNAR